MKKIPFFYGRKGMQTKCCKDVMCVYSHLYMNEFFKTFRMFFLLLSEATQFF